MTKTKLYPTADGFVVSERQNRDSESRMMMMMMMMAAV
jgi:hypothetical protein